MKSKANRRRFGGGIAALLAALIVAAVVSGCGSSGGGSSSESSTTASSAAGSSQVGANGGPGGGFELSEEAQACLKEKDIELPQGGQGSPGGGAPPESTEGGEPPEGFEPPQGTEGGAPAGAGSAQFEEMQKAFEECGVETTGKPGGAPNTNSAAFRKQVKEYTACMRENGIDLPEPNLSGEGPVFDESEVDRESTAFKKASEQCQGLLGGQQSGSSEAGGERRLSWRSSALKTGWVDTPAFKEARMNNVVRNYN